MSPRLAVLVATAALTLTGAGGKAADPPPSPPVVRAVLVLDTADRALAAGVDRDRKTVDGFLAAHLPADRYTVTVVRGTDATPDRVLRTVRDLPVRPADTVFVYYSGHGSTRPDRGHTLELQAGKQPLPRAELLKAVAGTKPALAVVLTDCCSDRFPAPQVAARAGTAPARPKEPTALAQKLFFDSRGLVDLTAADKDVAYADDDRGGYFTFATAAVAERNRDRPLTWPAFAAAVAAETTAVHEAAIRAGIAPDLRGPEKPQKPVTLAPLPGEAVTAVVGLVNPTAAPVEVEYRWAAGQPWVKLKLPPGGRQAVAARVRGLPADGPALEVRLDGASQSLPANVYERPAPPGFADAKVYKFAESAPPPPGNPGKAAARSFAVDPMPPADPTPVVPTPVPSPPTP